MADEAHLEQTLWRASEALRRVLDAHSIGESLLALFFLKYVTDVVASGDSQRFNVPEQANFYELLKLCDSPRNVERIDAALDVLRLHQSKFDGLFANLRFENLVGGNTAALDRALADALRILGDTSNLGELGRGRLNDALDYLLERFAFVSAGAGELYTPRQILQLLARLVDPRPGDSIYDPACGTGGFLLSCARLIQERYRSEDYSLHGQEPELVPWMLGKTHAFLQAEDRQNIQWGDALRYPLHSGTRLQQFDVIVSNPPFSVAEWGREQAERDAFGRFKRGLPPKSRADYAFLLHMIESMRPDTGRMAVIMPHGALYRGGSERDIRKNLIESDLLETVIGLPPKLFYNTAIATVVLVFRVKRDDENILIIDASRECAAGRKLNELREQDVEQILATVRSRKSVQGYAAVVSREQIAAHDFNLNIPLYVSNIEEQASVDLVALRERQQVLNAELVVLGQDIDSRLQQLLDQKP